MKTVDYINLGCESDVYFQGCLKMFEHIITYGKMLTRKKRSMDLGALLDNRSTYKLNTM